MVLVLVAGGAWLGYRWLTGPGCSHEVRLTVAAAPEIAPAIEDVAADWVGQDIRVDGSCVAVAVTATDPVDVAAAVATRHGVSLTGVGRASGTTVIPDVWLPDSSIWLSRLRSAAPGFTPTNNTSVARSPVVIAMPEPVATSIGWPGKALTWADLLKQMTTGKGMRAGIVEPTRDAASLAGLLALAATADTGGTDGPAATTALLRSLATGKSALRQDLLERFPRANDPASIASGLTAAALSEEGVIAFNAEQPPIELVALYLDSAPMALDYPYAIMSGTDAAKVAAAEALFSQLSSAAFRDRLGARGLRGADGSWGAGFAAPAGAPGPAEATPTSGETVEKTATGPDPAVVERLLSTWTAVTQPGRMLAIVDVSGSMAAPVPTAGDATRMQVTLAAAQGGLRLFDDSWAVGLWTFSTELVGERDYQELVPIGPLSTQRGDLQQALSQIVPKATGDTGLYDTLLAAYRAVQDGWEPGRVNSVVMFTDGRNDDGNGISYDNLIAELKNLTDPGKPIQVIIVGIGTEVSEAELDGITEVTGGGVFITEDPAKIGEIFLKAVSLRPAPR